MIEQAKEHIYKKDSFDKKITVETFSEEFKSVSLKTNELEYRQIENNVWTFSPVWPSSIQPKGAKSSNSAYKSHKKRIIVSSQFGRSVHIRILRTMSWIIQIPQKKNGSRHFCSIKFPNPMFRGNFMIIRKEYSALHKSYDLSTWWKYDSSIVEGKWVWHQGTTKLIALSENTGLSGLHCMEEKHWLFNI